MVEDMKTKAGVGRSTTMAPNVGRSPAGGREEGLDRPLKDEDDGFYQLVTKY